MFDRYLIAPTRHEHSAHNTTVHEHRAPTDASVKLLREMEQAAEQKMLGAIRLEGCAVDCVIIHQSNILKDEHQFLLRYKLGSKTREVRHTYCPKMVSAQQANDDCFNELKAALAEDIAFHLLSDPFVNTLRRVGFDLT